MKINKLKKDFIFSLIALVFCCIMLYSANSIFNITGFINTKVEIIKEKEMKFMFGERKNVGDKYSENSIDYNIDNVNYQDNVLRSNESNYINYKQQEYISIKNQYLNTDSSWSYYFSAAKLKLHEATYMELKKQVDRDSYRNKKLGFYYVFDYEYTMDALKKLEPVIEKTAAANNTPKALIAAVLFREMMFVGQEDLLDGMPIIGGESLGICQIGIENARFNEQTIHGKETIITKKTDDEIKTLLLNPKEAVYFCAVQLKARAIKLTDNKKVNLNELDEAQIHLVLEAYNQSMIAKTIGPIKTKIKYAEETYKYYELFSNYYELE